MPSFISLPLGLVLLIGGTELWLRMSGSGGGVRVAAWIAVGAGITLLGLVRRPDRWTWTTIRGRLVVAGAFCTYLTWSAFSRFHGLAKDIEPTPVNEAVYFLKWLLVLAALVSMVSLTQIVAMRLLLHGTKSPSESQS